MASKISKLVLAQHGVAAPQSAQWLTRTYVGHVPCRFLVGFLSVPCRSRDVPCPCSWARWASGGGAAVRVGRLRPRGGVVAATAACRDRIRLPTRALSLRRDPSLVAHGRSSSSSPPLAAATCPCRPCVTRSFSPPPPPTTRASWNDVARQPAVSNTPVAACGMESSPITRLCRPAPMMAKDLHPPHVLVWLLEPRECVCAAYICPT